MATVPQQEVRVTVGVDTHEDVHVAVALDQLGRWLGELSIATNRGGFARLVAWASGYGVIDRIGIEGTGSWGAGLSRWLRAEGLVTVEVDRPDRKTRRHGKSDTLDAEAAARAVLSGTATAVPKTADGPVEMIRVLRLTRRSAVKNRTMTANQISAVTTTAPDDLREQLRGLSIPKRVALAAKYRIAHEPSTVSEATRFALRELARRYQQLTEQIQRLDAQLDRLVAATAPALVAKHGIGTHTAAALLVSAGDNPERLVHEGSFAHLTGAAPLDASSGKQQRHRLNRGGDRDANAALYQIALTRSSRDEGTKLYLKRRIAEGKTKKEAFRCLKRYVAREVHRPSSKPPLCRSSLTHRSIQKVWFAPATLESHPATILTSCERTTS